MVTKPNKSRLKGFTRVRNNGLLEYRFTYNKKQYSVYSHDLRNLKHKVKLKKFELKNQNKIKTEKIIIFETSFLNWFNLYKFPNLSILSIKRVKQIINKYILPAFGKLTLKQVTANLLQRFFNNLQDKPRQQRYCYVYISAYFKYAVASGVLLINPCLNVIVKTKAVKKGIALTKLQQDQLLNYLDNNNVKLGNLFKLYLFTGMRRSEALNLTNNDIDRVNNIIYINGTKTVNAKRTLPTTQTIINLIPNTVKPFNYKPDYVDKQFKIVCNALGFNDIKLHSLRHTFATRMFESGVDLKVIQSLLGHSTINITADTYTHIQVEYKKDLIKNIDFLK